MVILLMRTCLTEFFTMFYFILFYLTHIHKKKGKNLPERVFTSGNVGPDRVSRRASLYFVTQRNKCHGRPGWVSSSSCWSGRTRSHRGPIGVEEARVFTEGVESWGGLNGLSNGESISASESAKQFGYVLLVLEHEEPGGFFDSVNDILVNGIFPGVKQVSFFWLQLVWRGGDQVR